MLRNGLYNVSSQAVRGTIGLIALPFLIRFLGIPEFGIWSLSYAALALFTLGEAGFSTAAVVFLSKDLASQEQNEANQTLTFVLLGAGILSTVLGLLLWFTGTLLVRPLVAFTFVERAEAGRALQMAGVAIFFYILQRTLVGIEQAFDKYGAVNFLDVGQSLLGNCGLVTVAFFGGRSVAMMEWQSITWAIFSAFHSWYVHKLYRARGFNLRWSTNKAKKIFRFSVAAWATALGSMAFGQCDRLVVGGILGSSLLGVYSAITNVSSKINSFSGSAVQPLVPSISRDLAMNVSSEGRIRQAAQLNALIAAESGIFLFVFADWVMRVIAPGSATIQNILGLQIATIIYVCYSLNAPGYYVLFSLGEARTNAVVVLCSAFFSLALIFAGAKYFGLLGALAGNVGYLATLTLLMVSMKRMELSLGVCVQWIMHPILILSASFAFGILLHEHTWWRATVALAGSILLLIWFFHATTSRSWKSALLRQGSRV
jgi:O-antigen/teichoic acid export membrane protein